MECNVDGLCVEPCVPDCWNKECGDDGCSGDCGECDEGTTCNDGLCVASGSEGSDVLEADDDAVGADADDSVWKDKDGYDPAVEDDMEGEGGASPPGLDECEEGEHKRYGKCVPIDGTALDELGPAMATGCSAATDPSTGSVLLLVLLALALCVARRRKGSDLA